MFCFRIKTVFYLNLTARGDPFVHFAETNRKKSRCILLNRVPRLHKERKSTSGYARKNSGSYE